ncbi:short-chain dehydrogenase/reductase, subgroup 5 [Campylobacter insulaenigrae]|uniref:Short-chain dehydrogenase/reductase, subgroup 5 n=1 Tax=Campylobacter insulaenigrae NCTC 12927 TaxID=1031564 RepID=A0A0A8H1P9_9BACT|nr:short-chain dehydrogenase/reductase, subgroup 5 [Campylobacter insulaenigrae]AJC87902.1 short-chain dehydrogenase/reductase, subgroup 5 [Campylobacter insulaenigrae NCTC 12927]MCR6570315.1 short-chain dehydrogenase/reductase, subgroup 5 [Campylobacter insulaenigrae]MCR6571717.1 short-chain dehydrogenase/reductase, subgroup 5 [Campylobacter insulaenigrae]MCR6573354.1 short-chain dehydrogenase/reductase, subgroup 5 [Campylobacter insulaenigrae]MCR6576489.1 short-chain dehydrogenase/reductase,
MKTALITGASSGIGLETLKALIELDYKVVAIARRKERLERIQQQFQDKVFSIVVDVKDKDTVFDAVQNLPSCWKDISLLVNNAGLALGLEDFSQLSIDDIENMVDTNVKGFLYIAKAVLPLLKRNKNAHIINLGSIAANVPYYGGNVYCGTKAFVAQFSRALRTDLRGTNIKVTNIAPGLCKTEFSEVRFKGNKHKAEEIYKNTKYITAQDIARVISFIITLPEHININEIELMPVTQTWAGTFSEKIYN